MDGATANSGRGTALVTGATGFVGRNLVEELLRRGVVVTCLVRRSSDTRALAQLGVRLVTADLPGPDPALVELVSGHEVVYHVAGAVKALNLDGFLRANAVVTEEVCAACVAAARPPRRLVLMSSLGAVGPADPGATLTEAQAPRPVTDYGRSKLEGERRALAYRDRLPIAIVRPTAVYGPRDHELLPVVKLARRGLVPLMGGRDQIVNLVHVDDVVQATILASERDVESGEVFHVGDLRGYSMTEFGALLCGVFGRRPRFLALPRALVFAAALGSEIGGRLRRRPAIFNRQKLPELRASWVMDVARLRDRLGWAPRWDLPTGLRATVAWYRQEGWLPADDAGGRDGGPADGTLESHP
ncbi:MAG: NAD-dependent epimerase/dehydratase family protein [Deltaproteobacteria bacterium]|nr:NAD-dependent epimerase/dehydratase family protein [Deltaproteobacteria bacterium]